MPIHWKAALVAPLLLSAGNPVERGPLNADWPPARFQGDNMAVVIFASDVSAFCGKAPAGYTVMGCQGRRKGVPVIVLPNPCTSGAIDGTAKIACHELGHLNGWGGNHEL